MAGFTLARKKSTAPPSEASDQKPTPKATKKPERKKPFGPEAGVDPRVYKRSIRWQMDIDYADKLSEEEKAWLGANLLAYYDESHKFVDLPDDERKEAGRRRSKQRNDVMNGPLVYPDAAEDSDNPALTWEQVAGEDERDWSTPLPHDDDPEYVDAQRKMAENAPPIPDVRSKKVPTNEEWRKAARKIRRYTSKHRAKTKKKAQ